MKLQYCVPEEDPVTWHEFDSGHNYLRPIFDIPQCLSWIAQAAAEDYYAYHDGWESHWPLTIKIRDDARDHNLGTFSVSMQNEIRFVSMKVKVK